MIFFASKFKLSLSLQFLFITNTSRTSNIWCGRWLVTWKFLFSFYLVRLDTYFGECRNSGQQYICQKRYLIEYFDTSYMPLEFRDWANMKTRICWNFLLQQSAELWFNKLQENAVYFYCNNLRETDENFCTKLLQSYAKNSALKYA